MSLADAFAALAQADADLLAINCVNGPQEALRFVERLPPFEVPIAVFPTLDLHISVRVVTFMRSLRKSWQRWVP